MMRTDVNYTKIVDELESLRAENAALRERVVVLESFVAKVADKHQECEDGYYSCPKAWNAFGHGKPDECWCLCEPARAALAAAKPAENGAGGA